MASAYSAESGCEGRRRVLLGLLPAELPASTVELSGYPFFLCRGCHLGSINTPRLYRNTCVRSAFASSFMPFAMRHQVRHAATENEHRSSVHSGPKTPSRHDGLPLGSTLGLKESAP